MRSHRVVGHHTRPAFSPSPPRHYRFLHSRKLFQPRLDLPQIHPQPPHPYLQLAPPHHVNRSIGFPSPQSPRPPDPCPCCLAILPIWARYRYVRQKPLALPSCSSHPDLPYYPHRHRLHLPTHDVPSSATHRFRCLPLLFLEQFTQDRCTWKVFLYPAPLIHKLLAF